MEMPIFRSTNFTLQIASNLIHCLRKALLHKLLNIYGNTYSKSTNIWALQAYYVKEIIWNVNRSSTSMNELILLWKNNGIKQDFINNLGYTISKLLISI